MSKIIRKSEKGNKQFLSRDQNDEAEALLQDIITKVEAYESSLKNVEQKSVVENNYGIGQLMRKIIEEADIPENERLFLWEEIKGFTNSDLQKTKDRTEKRGFYEYCYRLSLFNKSLAEKLNWRTWSELLDRHVLDGDGRLLSWLVNKVPQMSQEDFRMMMRVLHSYLRSNDTTVFTQDELFEQYDLLFSVVENWDDFYEKFFESNKDKLTAARKRSLSKYKNKYIESCLDLIQHSHTNDLSEKYEAIFRVIFVDIDTSSRFNVTKDQ